MRISPGTARATFQKMISSECDECQVWPHARRGRYGAIRHGGRMVDVHRLACELVNGPAPTDTHQAAHRCGNCLCINRQHLRWATPSSNAADKVAHGTQPCGEIAPNAKLTNSQVREIRRRFAAGESQASLSRAFALHFVSVHNIVRRKSWKWID